LGIPEEGRYIVLAGGLSTVWKGVDRLADAFSRMRRGSPTRLLLAGSLGRSLGALLQDQYAGEISRGEIITIDRFVSDKEMAWAIASADLVAVPYPRFQRVSGILLRAVAAGRPVITDDCGWLGYVTRKFQLGWTCDVKNTDRFPGALSTALDASVDYKQSDVAGLFRRYHSLENFREHWMREIQILSGSPIDEPQVTWEQLDSRVHDAVQMPEN
jgi:glycosyltransferase involved in cell wall biosynthesis